MSLLEKQDAEENIWTLRGISNKGMEKICIM
jgi:hypothetical protein